MAPFLTEPMRIMRNWSDKPIAGVRQVRVDALPAEMFGEVHEHQARRNHGQSLQRLNQRGGLSAQEALCILSCMPCTSALIHLPHEEAHRLLYAMRSAFRGGALQPGTVPDGAEA